MHCNKILLESLERILLDKFLEQENEDAIFASLPEGTRDKINTLIYSQTKYTMDDLMSDEGFITYMRKYTEFKKSVRDGVLGKTAVLDVLHGPYLARAVPYQSSKDQ